jgi:hypothetical protein
MRVAPESLVDCEVFVPQDAFELHGIQCEGCKGTVQKKAVGKRSCVDISFEDRPQILSFPASTIIGWLVENDSSESEDGVETPDDSSGESSDERDDVSSEDGVSSDDSVGVESPDMPVRTKRRRVQAGRQPTEEFDDVANASGAHARGRGMSGGGGRGRGG